MLYKKKNKNIIKNIINRKKNIINRKKNIVQAISICNNINIKYNIINKIFINRINRNKKICINTGRYSAVYKKYNLTRQQINKKLTNNNIDNINIISW